MLDSYVVIMPGLLLIIPGLISDVIGLLLLIPPLRRWLIRRAVGDIYDPPPGLSFWRAPLLPRQVG